MVEEAIRNGTWLPTAGLGGLGGRALGKKPKLFEAHLGGSGGSGAGSSVISSGKEKGRDMDGHTEVEWDGILVSGQNSMPLFSVHPHDET